MITAAKIIGAVLIIGLSVKGAFDLGKNQGKVLGCEIGINEVLRALDLKTNTEGLHNYCIKKTQ